MASTTWSQPGKKSQVMSAPKKGGTGRTTRENKGKVVEDNTEPT